MYPHSNRLPRWLLITLLATGVLLLVTGLLWDAVHFIGAAGQSELAFPHPWEAPLMRLHGLAVIGFLFALGGLGPVHVPRGWRQHRNSRSGLLLIGAAVILALSGYALYYWVSEATRGWVGLLHAAIGTLMAVLLGLHALWRRQP